MPMEDVLLPAAFVAAVWVILSGQKYPVPGVHGASGSTRLTALLPEVSNIRRPINLTVPKRVRRTGGATYRLWIAKLGPHDVDEHLDIPAPTPLRSVINAASAGTDPRLIEQTIDTIERRQLVSVGDVEKFKRAYANRALA
jgi:hypothetical protein